MNCPELTRLLPEFSVRIGVAPIPGTLRVWLARDGMTHRQTFSMALLETPQFLATLLRADFEKEYAKGKPK